MQIQIDQLEVPVCNSFQAKIYNNQLCYEVDPNQFKNKDKGNNKIQRDLRLGLDFIMDYNEDRQITSSWDDEEEDDDDESFVARVEEKHENKNAFIILDTIGDYFGDF